MEEEVKRLQPTKETLRELYLKSGNRCAFPKCSALMMDVEGTFIGQICHIEAADLGGERFNPKQTNEQRRAFSNLMLMCYEHHQVTNNTAKYSTPSLQTMKAEHERKFSDIVEKMRATVSDHTVTSEISRTSTLSKMDEVLGWGNGAEENADTAKLVDDFAEKVKMLPIPSRQLLSVIITRGRTYGGYPPRMELPLSELQMACDLTLDEIRQHMSILENRGVGYPDKDHRYDYDDVVKLHILDSGWCFFNDLQKFCSASGTSMDQIIVDLRFDLLDK